MKVIMVRYCCWLLCFQCLQCIQWWRMILMSEKKEQTRSKQFLNFRLPPSEIFLIGFPPSEMGRGSLRSTLVQLLWHVKEVFSLYPSTHLLFLPHRESTIINHCYKYICMNFHKSSIIHHLNTDSPFLIFVIFSPRIKLWGHVFPHVESA